MSIHSRIQNNAQEIARLHQQMHAAIDRRSDGPKEQAQWQAVCREFHEAYQSLAFPGGPRDARHRLRAGDQNAIEYALAFLEVRPYFFRSGYMYKEYMRVLRNCPLTADQRSRHDILLAAYQQYRAQRRSAKGPG